MTGAEKDRRKFSRVKVEMWVEESRERETYFQRSANLSAGGIFLERTIPHPLGTAVSLKFTLPNESEPLEVKGTIVNVGGDDPGGGMGISFADLETKVKQRLEAFIQASEKAEKAP